MNVNTCAPYKLNRESLVLNFSKLGHDLDARLQLVAVQLKVSTVDLSIFSLCSRTLRSLSKSS